MCKFAECLKKFTIFHYSYWEGHAIQGSLFCVLYIHITVQSYSCVKFSFEGCCCLKYDKNNMYFT